MQNYTYFKQFYQDCRIYSLSMNLHKYQLYLLEQHSESFKIWSAIIRIDTECKSLIMKLGPEQTGIRITTCPGSSKAGIEGKLVILFLEMNMYVYVALLELFAMLYTVLKYAYK